MSGAGREAYYTGAMDFDGGVKPETGPLPDPAFDSPAPPPYTPLTNEEFERCRVKIRDLTRTEWEIAKVVADASYQRALAAKQAGQLRIATEALKAVRREYSGQKAADIAMYALAAMAPPP